MQPEPGVIGAKDSELETLTSPAWPHPLGAEELVSALFGSLAAAAEVERRSLEQMGGLSDKRLRLNRCNTYLSPLERKKWEARARRFLARRRDIARTLPTEALYSAMALQHLLELDTADAELGDDERRFHDSYTDGVNNQFLLDASRGCFEVEGEVFHFARAQADESEDAFVARLLEAVRRAMPEQMVARITTAMSQSGLASLERACLCTVVVSGGKQLAEYALASDPELPGSATVTLRVRRFGFSEYFAGAEGDDMEPLPCDRASSLEKSATVVFDAEGQLDVTDLREQVDILRDGRPLPPGDLCRSIPRPARTRETLRASLSPRRLLARACECLRRMCRLPRQLRDLNESTAGDA